MACQELVSQFRRDGFVLIEGFFDEALMDELDRVIADHFGADPAFRHDAEFLRQSRTEVIPWFPQTEGVASFDRIDSDTDLERLTEAVLGPGWRRLYCMVMFSKPGSSGQAWHQDCAADDPARHNLNRLVYTSDITGETGGETVVVPGSHKAGLLPAGDPDVDFEGQVVLAPRKGSLLLLHGHAWHRVLPVRDSVHRFSSNYRAAPAGTPDDITDVCVYRNLRYRFSTSSVVEERWRGPSA